MNAYHWQLTDRERSQVNERAAKRIAERLKRQDMAMRQHLSVFRLSPAERLMVYRGMGPEAWQSVAGTNLPAVKAYIQDWAEIMKKQTLSPA